jgi:hypothetical protein
LLIPAQFLVYSFSVLSEFHGSDILMSFTHPHPPTRASTPGLCHLRVNQEPLDASRLPEFRPNLVPDTHMSFTPESEKK